MNKYKKHISCSYGYELICVDDKSSKLFKIYLAEILLILEDYNFINNMIEESEYCSGVMNKHFNKELVMTKEDNEDFDYGNDDVKEKRKNIGFLWQRLQKL